MGMIRLIHIYDVATGRNGVVKLSVPFAPMKMSDVHGHNLQLTLECQKVLTSFPLDKLSSSVPTSFGLFSKEEERKLFGIHLNEDEEKKEKEKEKQIMEYNFLLIKYFDLTTSSYFYRRVLLSYSPEKKSSPSLFMKANQTLVSLNEQYNEGKLNELLREIALQEQLLQQQEQLQQLLHPSLSLPAFSSSLYRDNSLVSISALSSAVPSPTNLSFFQKQLSASFRQTRFSFTSSPSPPPPQLLSLHEPSLSSKQLSSRFLLGSTLPPPLVSHPSLKIVIDHHCHHREEVRSRSNSSYSRSHDGNSSHHRSLPLSSLSPQQSSPKTEVADAAAAEDSSLDKEDGGNSIIASILEHKACLDNNTSFPSFAVVIRTNRFRTEILREITSFRDEFYLIHVVNSHDITHISFLQFSTNRSFSFFLLREFIDKSSKFSRIWKKLFKLLLCHPLLSSLLISRRMPLLPTEEMINASFLRIGISNDSTDDLCDNNGGSTFHPSLLFKEDENNESTEKRKSEFTFQHQKFHCFAKLLPKNAGASLVVVHSEHQPIIGTSFESFEMDPTLPISDEEYFLMFDQDKSFFSLLRQSSQERMDVFSPEEKVERVIEETEEELEAVTPTTKEEDIKVREPSVVPPPVLSRGNTSQLAFSFPLFHLPEEEEIHNDHPITSVSAEDKNRSSFNDHPFFPAGTSLFDYQKTDEDLTLEVDDSDMIGRIGAAFANEASSILTTPRWGTSGNPVEDNEETAVEKELRKEDLLRVMEEREKDKEKRRKEDEKLAKESEETRKKEQEKRRIQQQQMTKLKEEELKLFNEERERSRLQLISSFSGAYVNDLFLAVQSKMISEFLFEEIIAEDVETLSDEIISKEVRSRLSHSLVLGGLSSSLVFEEQLQEILDDSFVTIVNEEISWMILLDVFFYYFVHSLVKEEVIVKAIHEIEEEIEEKIREEELFEETRNELRKKAYYPTKIRSRVNEQSTYQLYHKDPSLVPINAWTEEFSVFSTISPTRSTRTMSATRHRDHARSYYSCGYSAALPSTSITSALEHEREEKGAALKRDKPWSSSSAAKSLLPRPKTSSAVQNLKPQAFVSPEALVHALQGKAGGRKSTRQYVSNDFEDHGFDPPSGMIGASSSVSSYSPSSSMLYFEGSSSTVLHGSAALPLASSSMVSHNPHQYIPLQQYSDPSSSSMPIALPLELQSELETVSAFDSSKPYHHHPFSASRKARPLTADKEGTQQAVIGADVVQSVIESIRNSSCSPLSSGLKKKGKLLFTAPNPTTTSGSLLSPLTDKESLYHHSLKSVQRLGFATNAGVAVDLMDGQPKRRPWQYTAYWSSLLTAFIKYHAHLPSVKLTAKQQRYSSPSSR
jgi:hypothetical protein